MMRPLPFLLAALLLCGCSLWRKEPAPMVPVHQEGSRASASVPVKPPAVRRPAAPATPERHQSEAASEGERSLHRQVAQLLERRQFGRVLRLCARKGRAGTPVSGFAAEYVQALNGLAAEAEDAFLQENFGEAGKLYALVLEYHPRDGGLARKVSCSAERAAARRESCSDRLMDRGLAAYRKGHLQEAIGHWRRLLAFDADHTQARKAVQNAASQLKNLEKLQ